MPTPPKGEPDWVAVERAAGGDRFLHLRPVERGQAVQRLTDLGLSTKQIAERLGTTPRTVTRWRVRTRNNNQEGTT